jgi:hypothetical protein
MAHLDGMRIDLMGAGAPGCVPIWIARRATRPSPRRTKLSFPEHVTNWLGALGDRHALLSSALRDIVTPPPPLSGRLEAPNTAWWGRDVGTE